MILCIIELSLIVITFIMLGVSIFVNTKCRKAGKHYTYFPENEEQRKLNEKADYWNRMVNRFSIIEWDNFATFIFTAVSVIASFASLFIVGFLIDGRCNRCVTKKYEKLIIEKEALEYRLEEGFEVGNELLYQDIVTFNQKINSYKLDKDNPWINWFVDPKLAEIEKIDYKK